MPTASSLVMSSPDNRTDKNTVEPLNNRYFVTIYFWCNFTLLYKGCRPSEVKLYCHGLVGTTELGLYREVKCAVSFVWMVF